MPTAQTVIIGGGCVGTSTLYHLTRLGLTDVVLLEADALGAGSTSKAAGGIRLQHEDVVNTEIALRSLAEFERFEELTGVDIGLKQVGYLFVLDNERDVASFTAAAGRQREFGIPTEVLDVAAVRGLVPQLNTDDVLAATYCPIEGYATPEAVVQGYAAAARRLGAKIKVGTPAVEIITDSEGIAGVRTPTETISTRSVVIAAGVGSPHLASPLGFELPVHGEARTMYYSGTGGCVPPSSPLVVDFSTGFYFHGEGPGLVFGGREATLEELSEPAVHRLPTIADAAISSSWWGYYDMSPDHNAIIGRGPVAGVCYATGFSGHGFMQSPAVGEHLAELILGRPTTLDLAGLGVERFAEGRSRTESFII